MNCQEALEDIYHLAMLRSLILSNHKLRSWESARVIENMATQSK